MAKRNSWFRQNFMGADAFHSGVTPITLAVYAREIPPERLKEVLKSKIPPGYVGTYPLVVKCLDGEWNVSANGSVQFFPLGQSPNPVAQF